MVNAVMYFFFFKQKTAYEMRISDWSSDVCSSDLARALASIILRIVISFRFKPQGLDGAPRGQGGAPERLGGDGGHFGPRFVQRFRNKLIGGFDVIVGAIAFDPPKGRAAKLDSFALHGDADANPMPAVIAP